MDPLSPSRLHRWALGVVLLHLVVLTVHASAHSIIPVPIPSALDAAFIAIVIFLAPVASAVLLRSRPGIGRPTLFLSMLLSFLYGALSHYILESPDNVAVVSSQGWGLLFHGTTAALAVLEGLGVAVGALLLRSPLELAPAKMPTTNP